jgi:pimeloyl-ACP methyl ester carboxylesterase
MQRVALQLGIDQDFADDYEVSPDESGVRAREEPYRLERIPLPWVVKKQVMKVLLRDVHHYLFNSESNPRGDRAYRVRDELRARLIAALKRGAEGGGPHVLVSHSMGTIIAYDVMRNCPECPAIDGFITLGSPLGLDEVQDKLKPDGQSRVDFPSAKLRGRWVNVFDRMDPVAGFDPFFANDYQKDGRPAIKDIEEQNWGKWRHSIQKYLSGPRLRTELRGMLGS